MIKVAQHIHVDLEVPEHTAKKIYLLETTYLNWLFHFIEVGCLSIQGLPLFTGSPYNAPVAGKTHSPAMSPYTKENRHLS